MDRRDFLRTGSLAGAYALGSKLTMTEAQGAVAANSQSIRIHCDEVKGSLPHAWEECVGSDRAVVAMREQWLQDLELVRKVTGVKSVRFHGLFNDEMGVWPSGRQPNFLYIDMVFDAMLDRGLKPLVELSFMPGALASGTKRSSGIAAIPRRRRIWRNGASWLAHSPAIVSNAMGSRR